MLLFHASTTAPETINSPPSRCCSVIFSLRNLQIAPRATNRGASSWPSYRCPVLGNQCLSTQPGWEVRWQSAVATARWILRARNDETSKAVWRFASHRSPYAAVHMDGFRRGVGHGGLRAAREVAAFPKGGRAEWGIPAWLRLTAGYPPPILDFCHFRSRHQVLVLLISGLR